MYIERVEAGLTWSDHTTPLSHYLVKSGDFIYAELLGRGMK